jgi:hypothetical protein
MKLKKIRDLFPLNDRTKLLVSICAAGAVLLAAMLLPLAFRSRVGTAPEEPGAERDRFALFADYWLRGPEESALGVSHPDKLREGTKTACEERMRMLVERCAEDHALNYTGPTGSEYTVIRDESGTQILLCRMWLEARGDWQNWLDVCFDAESGEIYYLYLSRECLTNRQDYQTAAPPDPAGIAEQLAEGYGWKLRWLDQSDSGSSAAVYETESGTVCYQIDCKTFDTLIDIKLCCR